jgi:type II secretory pathway pseudopilin PulG
MRHARGLVLLALLIMLVLIGVGTLGAAEFWATSLKRERETELLFIGDQYRRAIAEYWRMTPGRRAYPPSIESLLTDERFPNPVHHLRRKYRDPMTQSGDPTTQSGDLMTQPGEFEVIKLANGVSGVHSTSQDKPIKHAQFPKAYTQFEQAENYSQWMFVFNPAGTINGGVNNGPAPIAPVPGSPSQGPAPGVPVPQLPTGR